MTVEAVCLLWHVVSRHESSCVEDFHKMLLGVRRADYVKYCRGGGVMETCRYDFRPSTASRCTSLDMNDRKIHPIISIAFRTLLIRGSVRSAGNFLW